MNHKILLVSIILMQQFAYAQNEQIKLIQEFGKVKVYGVVEQNKIYENVSIRIDTLVVKSDSSEVLVNFDYKNYTLGAQTDRKGNGLCANSDKGQHIHLIVDNEPYTALYSGVYKYKASLGHHVVLGFLSRSYHQSIKLKNAYAIEEYTVGKYKDDFKEKKPHLFYSRPKGTYVNADTASILIDYYLINCELSEKGFQVLVEIDSKYKFKVNQWTPLLVNGLNTGDHTVKLTLVNKKGEAVESKFNGVTRKFILSKNPG